MLIALGSLLLVVTVLGDTTALGDYASDSPRSWERYDPNLARSARSVPALIAAARHGRPDYDGLNPQAKMLALYGAVVDRFTHSDGAKHTLFTNWILYLAGFSNDAFRTMMSPALFLSKGHSLVCSQSSYLLAQMALSQGIRARQVGLKGHVVMEAWYNKDWHMFDPDEEVVPRNGKGDIMSVATLAQNSRQLTRAYQHKNNNLIHIFASRQNNTYMTYPAGTYFVWKAQVLLYIEKLAQVMKYIFSIGLIVGGLLLLARYIKRRTARIRARV